MRFRLMRGALGVVLLLGGLREAGAQVLSPSFGAQSCAPPPPSTVQASPPLVFHADPTVTYTPQPFDSLTDAQAAYDFPLLLPTAIPSDYQLTGILYSHASMLVDLLSICYRSPDGHYLLIEQGFPMDVGASRYRMTPDDEKGTSLVQGEQAYWAAGILVGTPPTGSLVWQPGPLRLEWHTDMEVPRPEGGWYIPPGSDTPVPIPPLYISYAVESDTLSLDDLLTIADSVQLYP